MEQPSIYPFGFRIDQPITTLTNMLVALICFYALYKLVDYKTKNRIYIHARAYFFCMGFATFIGGIVSHGFLYALSPSWKFLGWAFAMYSINRLERAMIFYSRPLMSSKLTRFFDWFNIFELIVFAGLAYGNLLFGFLDINSFIFVEIHSAYGLVVFVFGFGMFNYIKRGHNRDILYFLYAVGAAACAAIFFSLKIGISKWFNHIDISHIFMAISVYWFYLGFTKILSRTKNGLIDADGEHPEKVLVAD